MFLDEEHGRREFRVVAPNESSCEHVSALPLQFVRPQGGIAVWTDYHRGCTRQQMDAVVARARRWEPVGFSEQIRELMEKAGKEVFAATSMYTSTWGRLTM